MQEPPLRLDLYLRMRFFECNSPDIVGYSVALDQRGNILSIFSHKRDQGMSQPSLPLVPGLDDITDPAKLSLVFMPLHQDERITEIYGMVKKQISFRLAGISFFTDKGRTITFGSSRPEAFSIKRLVKVPPKPCRVFINELEHKEKMFSLRFIAFEGDENHPFPPPQDALPTLPESRLLPSMKSIDGWKYWYTSCSMREASKIYPCVDGVASSCWYQTLIGLLVEFADGRRDSFMGSYAHCMQCIADNGADDKIQNYVVPKFDQFIKYCEGEDTKPVTATVNLEPSATTDCDGCITTALEDYRGSTIMIVLGTKTVPTESLLEKSVFMVSTVRETVTYYRTGSASATATSETDHNKPDSPSGPNLATIIGPVIPSVVLLIVLTFLGFRWYKKKERIKDQEAQIEPDEEPKVEKAQLHSDCISRPTYELEGSTPFIPDPISSDGAEMAANEVAAHEMPTDKKLGERRTGESEEGQIMTEESKAEEAKAEERKSEEKKPDESKPGNGNNDAAGASK
ncbi:hypothetical protein Neosp_014587 [[Neocosmospora] mangrovei]